MAPISTKKVKYTSQSLDAAIISFRNGESISAAAKNHQIPYSTLYNKLIGKSPLKIQHSGPESILGAKVEKELVSWLLETSKMGFPTSKQMLLDTVQEIVEKSNLKTPFVNNRPGRKWFDSFLKRHKEVSFKHAEYIHRCRGSVTEEKIRSWFAEIQLLLEDDFEIFQHADRIFNADETGFFLSPAGLKIIGPTGKHVYQESMRSDKENITTLFTVNAEGLFAPPLTLFKYVRLPASIANNAPTFWSLGTSENGWMTGKCFFEYIANVFVPFLKTKPIQLPVILFLDGHKSHLTMELSDLCRRNKIILIALLPNATHILQPLDVSVFGPMKTKWKTITRQWRVDHDGVELSKQNIPAALNTFLSDTKMAANIMAGFRATGLCPFDPNHIDYSKIIQREIPQSVEMPNDFDIPINIHLHFIEQNIDHVLLFQFKEVFERNGEWDGSIESSKMFEFWRQIRRKCAKINATYTSTSENMSENVVPVDSPVDNPFCTSRQPAENAVPVYIPSEYLLDNAIDISENEPRPLKSVSDVLKEIVHWPKQPVRKSKRNVEHIPCVLTSDKWQEIQVAKEKENVEKEFKKIERKKQAEMNKQIKQEKANETKEKKLIKNVQKLKNKIVKKKTIQKRQPHHVE